MTSAPGDIVTILGSCVSVCLWEARTHLAGMSHFILPQGGPSPSACLRHGDTSTVELLAQMEERGARRADLVAKVFGGARMFAASERDVGGHNASVALETLSALRIAVVAKDIGGCRGRKLVFRVEDGDAWVKLL